MKQPVEFRIQFAAPFGFTPDLPTTDVVTTKPKWRVFDFQFKRGGQEGQEYEMVARIDPRDLTAKNAKFEELQAFRDTMVAMLAMSAVVPVRLLSQGVFTFQLDDGKFEATSLGPMRMTSPMVPIPSLAALVRGFDAPYAVQAAAYFLWQALNADVPLYRFINLAVCAQVIANSESTAPKSAHPRCGDPACGFTLERCPKCGRDWTIPTALREHLQGVITDKALLTEFIALRNLVFHGSLSALLGNQPMRIPNINKSLLLVLRNFVAAKFGMRPIRADEIPLSNLDIINLSMSVFYQMPAGERPEPGRLPAELETTLEHTARDLQLSGLSADQVREEMHRAVDRINYLTYSTAAAQPNSSGPNGSSGNK